MQKNDLKWKFFKKYCKIEEIFHVNDIKEKKGWVLKMYDNPEWKSKIIGLLKRRQKAKKVQTGLSVEPSLKR